MHARRSAPSLPLLTILTLVGGSWAIPASASSIQIFATVPAGAEGCLAGGVSGATGPQSFSHNCSFGAPPAYQGTASAEGRADFGSLGVAVDLNLSSDLLQSHTNAGSLTALFSADGYVIDGPDATVTTSLNLDLSGIFAQACIFAGNCISAASVSATTANVTTSGEVSLQSSGLVQSAGSFNLAGLINGDNLQLTTLPFTVATGQPFTVAITLSTYGAVGSGSGQVTNDLLHTLTYNIGGPVFTLLDGYTANGPGVVDNRFGAVSTVPEPGSSLYLLVIGAASLSSARWRTPRKGASVRSAAGSNTGTTP